MPKEKGILYNVDSGQVPGEFYENHRKKLEKIFYAAASLLILAVIFLMFNLALPAGILILLTIITGLFLTRQIAVIFYSVRTLLGDISSANESKDNVITDFSHKIREPLNNLVFITDMLMGSELGQKEKDLLETFVASTKNMVTSVNELTMQSAQSISFESRKHIKFNL